MASPVAVVTGASSGIGLALTLRLLAKGWHVALLDISPPPAAALLPAAAALFIQTDVSSWPSQASAFARAYAWRARLDAAALNAGIDDRDDIFHALAPASSDRPPPPPTEPNMATFGVNLLGVYHGIKLFAHYASLTSAAKSTPGGDIVVTASSAGLYALPAVPQYTATKHALVGLVRALAPQAAERGFTINAVCPDMVPTALAPPGLMESYPEEAKTPMSTMLRAYDELLGLAEHHGARAAAGAEKKTGQVVEVIVDDLFYREQPAQLSKKQAAGEAVAKLWDDVYRERNIAFARKAEVEARMKMAESASPSPDGTQMLNP